MHPAHFDNENIDVKNVVVVTCQRGLNINEKSGYEKVKLEGGKNLNTEAQKFVRSGKNYLVLVDTSYSKNFSRLTNIKRRIIQNG